MEGLILNYDLFDELNNETLLSVDGGINWDLVGGIATVVSGVSGIVGGIALLCIPEQTLITKTGGVYGIVSGVGTTIAGGVLIYKSLK